MNTDRKMYRWRTMSEEQRQETLEHRKRQRLPWHSPPHYHADCELYLLTAACYEHMPIIGVSDSRLAAFEADLLNEAANHCQQVFAWCILPNHYHFLAHIPELAELLKAIGKLHGRTSYQWNGEDVRRGRQVWHRATETAMKSDRHFWASLNYVLHNAVRHGYVDRWQDWPYSNASEYLEEIGREVAAKRWRDYPILDYGADWDPPDL